MRHKRAGAINVIILGIFGLCAPFRASADTPSTELHVRDGVVQGNFTSGGLSNGFQLGTSLDLGLELIQSRTFSYMIRVAFSYDLDKQYLPYAFTGVGARYYLFSNSRGYAEDEPGIWISKKPNWRFYVGGDLGLSQDVMTLTSSPQLQSSSAFSEIGANLGVIYNIAPKVGIELEGGYSIGYGISTIAVVSGIARLILGMSVYF